MIVTKDKQTEAFVIMPISDPEGYETGHFKRVYEHIIKPACSQCKISCIRADDVKSTNYIIIDILRRILDSTLVICDLSSRNPNVLYELGIRHAFNLPVVLLKDTKTKRIFDIQNIRTLEYDEVLRVDNVKRDIDALAETIKKTIDNDFNNVNSIVQLLGMHKAEINNRTNISAESSLILSAIQDISLRLTQIEDANTQNNQETAPQFTRIHRTRLTLPNGEQVSRGDFLYAQQENGNLPLGTFWKANRECVWIKTEENFGFVVMRNDDDYKRLTTKKNNHTRNSNPSLGAKDK